MRVLCVAVLMLALLAFSGLAFGADPSGRDGKTSADVSLDLNPAVTQENIELLTHKAEAAKRLGRTDEAARLEAIIHRLAPMAVPSLEREEIIPELNGGVAESKHGGGSMIATSPWAEDRLIYQGNYSYDAWTSIEQGKPYAVDYDSLGNIYAVVVLADSTIHLFNSTDNGETWTDRRTIAPSAAYIPHVELLVSDDGDSAFAYVFYLWTGGGGGNLWCNVTNIATWGQARQAMLDAAVADSIVDFSVTRDHYWGEDYVLYADYQGGHGDADIFFTYSIDHGGSWSAPNQIQWYSGDTDLAYGGYSSGGNLYRAYTAYPADPDSSWINVRMSDDYGASWHGSETVRDNTAGDSWSPRVAAANTPRAAQRVFATYTTDFYNSGNLQVWSSRSNDGGLNWNIVPGPSYHADADEFGSSIAVLRIEDQEIFHLAYMYDDTATTTLDSIRVQSAAADTWPGSSTSVGINDSAFAFNCGPIATFSTGLPGVAYGGAGGVNVYYDNVWYTGAEEYATRIRNLEFGLFQNRPNPFSERTSIQFTLPGRADVSVKVYDVTGSLVRTLIDEKKEAGVHLASWDGRDDSGRPVSNGVYFYRLASGSAVQTRKLNLIR